jgi:RNA polymerase sigma factor (sigma-70 family)
MIDDRTLLESWRSGNAAAGEELFARHFSSVFAFFRRKLGDDVEDLVQQTFLDCVDSKQHIEGATFRAFLFTVARRRLIDHLRRVYRHGGVDVMSVTLEFLGTTPSQHVARDEETALLLAGLRRIPLEQQLVLDLAYFEELSGPEIAQVLDIAENTVRSRLARARKALRHEVELLASSPELLTSTVRRFRARLEAAPIAP